MKVMNKRKTLTNCFEETWVIKVNLSSIKLKVNDQLLYMHATTKDKLNFAEEHLTHWGRWLYIFSFLGAQN